MRVADNNSGTKNSEARKTDAAHGVFFHAHHPGVANPAAGGAAHRGKQAKLRDPGVVAAPRKRAYHADFQPLQFFFAPSRRTSADADAAHRAGRTLA